MQHENHYLTDRLSGAKWIWLPEKSEVNQYVDFRCSFQLTSVTDNTTLYLSADSKYAVYINGTLIPASQYADYPFYKVADEIDISHLVQKRENILSVIGYYQGEDSSIYRLGPAGVIFAVFQGKTPVLFSNSDTLCRPSHTYESGGMEKFSPQLSYSFHYDAVADDQWQKIGYIPGPEWCSSKETGEHPAIFSRPIHMMQWLPEKPTLLKAQGVFWDHEPALSAGDRMQRTALSARHPWNWDLPVSCTFPNPDGIYLKDQGGDGLYILVDLQEEESGLISLDLEVFENCEILIGFGEHLDDLRVRSGVGGRQFAVVYRARKGRQRFLYPFKRLGCRYLQLHFYTHAARVYYAGVRPVQYPVRYKPAFHCADALHNRIFQVSKRTLELCMHEHYEDCPWREQALYAMDSRNQMLCGYYIFDDVTFAQASLRLLALGQREDGLLELCAPARVGVTIPVFSLSFVTAVWENILFGGGKDFACEMLPAVERIMEVFASRQETNGLLGRFTQTPYWNFYEWSPCLDGEVIFREQELSPRYEAPLNAFYLMALQAAEKLASCLGNEKLAQVYHKRQKEVKRGIQNFWNSERGAFATFLENGEQSHYDKLTNALILSADGCTKAQSDMVLQQLTERNGILSDITLSCRIFLYEALMRQPDRYGRWVMEDIARIWGNMLFSGATSFWETAAGADDFVKAGSLCHGWSAIPIYFYYRYLLGIIPGQEKREPVFCGIYDAKEEREDYLKASY